MDAAALPNSNALVPSAPQDPYKPLGKELQDAVDDFQSILTETQLNKLLQIGNIRSPDTVMIFTAQLDRENQLKKGRGISARFMPLLQTVHSFSAIVDTFVSSNPDIAALIWGGLKYTLLVALNFTSYFEELSSVFMSFNNDLPRFEAYQALYPTSTQLQKTLCAFYASIIRCCKHVVEAMRRPSLQAFFQSAFGMSLKQEFAPDTEEIRKRAQAVKSEIKLAKATADAQEQMLQGEERKAASAQRRQLFRILPVVREVRDRLDDQHSQMSMRRSIEERQELLEFLSTHDYKAPMMKAWTKHQAGTSEWILTTPEFIRWEETGSSTLWCTGKIGSGKTILCANTIGHLLTTKSSDTQVAYHFIDYTNPDSLLAESALRSIILQVIRNTTLSEQVRDTLRVLKGKHLPRFQDWISLTEEAIRPLKAFYIFIDGLDEFDDDERERFLDALSSLISTCSGLRTFITGRDGTSKEVEEKFADVEKVSMSPDVLAPDIFHYVEVSIEARIKSKRLKVRDPTLLADIKQRLSQHADGMFLWVTFLIDELCTANFDDELRRLLYALPQDLQDTFHRALQRITQHKQTDFAQRVFRWVAAAKRPLNLDELGEVIYIEIGQNYSMPERQANKMDEVASLCENLIQVTEEGSRSVQFSHSSIRDYLVETSKPMPSGNFHVDLEEADHFLGEICVTYLHFNDFNTTLAQRVKSFRPNPRDLANPALAQHSRTSRLTMRLAKMRFGSGKSEDKGPKEVLDVSRALASFNRADSKDDLYHDHPFLEYAAEHWVYHTNHFSEKSTTWILWHELVVGGHGLAHVPWQTSDSSRDDEHLLRWSLQRHHHALLRYSSCLSAETLTLTEDLLIQSASNNDVDAIAALLQTGKCLRGSKEEALRKASRFGHLQASERLLAAGADVDQIGSDFRRALQEASAAGHVQCVDLLLSAGANVHNFCMENGRTALHEASAAGHSHVVERLLAANADFRACTEDGETAVRLAMRNGHDETAKLLIVAGAK